MNRLVILLIALFFINNCSLNENSRIWKDKEKDLSNQSNVKKIFAEEKLVVQEFNQGLNLDLSFIKSNNKFIDNRNNFGSQSYKGVLNKIQSPYLSDKKLYISFLLNPSFTFSLTTSFMVKAKSELESDIV